MKTAEDILRDKGGELVSVSPDTSLRRALQLMNEKNVGSVLVLDDDKPVGIWTERNLLQNVLNEGFNIDKQKISDFMRADLAFVAHSDSIYKLMDTCLGLRRRRLLVEKEGVFLGVLSAGDVMKACLQEKSSELENLSAIVSWKYYEDWKGKNSDYIKIAPDAL
ncbi:MAG: CBS domain-containing protein [Kiritimatiellia bacterium]|jgi:signal-transduction protein with cAMP-binding, CBS, and nucleotidyltransferase domain|nr:CBS domain-containing protein [Kiritimatiellia bacterium]MDP6847504.1 CBS domain-containing protein [Kiritimatiellia bacterium]